MIRFAIYDTRARARSAFRQALGSIAALEGIAPVTVSQFASLGEAVAALQDRRPDYFKLLLCNIDCLTDQDNQPLSLIKRRFPHTRLVLMSEVADSAIRTYQVHADDFILLSEGANEFTRVVKKQLVDINAQRGATITLKSRDGIEVLDTNSILFAETSSTGPLIHIADGREVQVRGTMQGLFAQMEHEECFARAGGSFIVNLDNVRSAGKSSLAFPDGSVIIVPIRARKPLQEALEAYRCGRQSPTSR